MQFKDQTDRLIVIETTPKRIISLVPSQTELLVDLGLESSLVGITKFCIQPTRIFREKKRVGGTKTVDYSKIEALNPDLIIANKEENTKEQIEYLRQNYPVWISDIQTLDDAYDMISSLGEITNKNLEAEKLIATIKNAFNSISNLSKPLSVAYLIWHSPTMTVNNQTFISHLLRKLNLNNVFSTLPSRYPEITDEELKKASPDVLFLSSEPFPFKEKHLPFYSQIVPNSKIILVDGQFFSWYGSRLLLAPDYFNKLIRLLK